MSQGIEERRTAAGGFRRCLGAAVALAAAFAAVAASRAWMIYSPYFEEIQYERAPMGLEALAILRGETPVMNWSEPYHGTVFSYLLAPFYALGWDPILTYSWVSVAANLVGTAAVFLFARRTWGLEAGLAALLYLALAPAYFPFYDVNSYALFVTLGGLGCYAVLAHLTARPCHPRWLWLCGIALGAAVWCHQLGVCFVAAAGATFLAARNRDFVRVELPRLVIGGVIGAAPLIAWNATFHWIVFRNFGSQDYASRKFETSVAGFWESIGSLLAANTQFWRAPPHASAWGCYGQLIFVALVGFGVWQWMRPVNGRREVRLGAGLLLVLVTITAILYSKSRWGVGAGFSRYLIPITFAIPIFVGGAYAVARRRSPLAAAVLMAALLVPGIHDRLQYEIWGESFRGTGARLGVALLDRLGVTRAYAHNRVSLPLTLASRERIIVSDFDGIPYHPYLDAVDDAAAPAIVTHRVLKIPSPEELVPALQSLHGRYRRAESGPYVVFYDFVPPDLPGGWLSPASWSLSASAKPDMVPAVVDREPLTVWTTDRPRRKGDWIAIDLGAIHRVDEVHFSSGVRIHDAPDGLVVETSLDGSHWTERQRAVGLPFYWWNGHPKHDDEGRSSFYFDPVEARHVRVRLLTSADPWNWSVAEIFVRAADVPASDAGADAFREGLLAERRGSIGVNYHSIHARFGPDVDTTDWGEVMSDYLRAMNVAPDNPDYSYRFTRALWTNGFLGPVPNGRDALRYEQLGLHDLAARTFAACAQSDDIASLCLDRAIASATDPATKHRLEALRAERFEPTKPVGRRFGAATLVGSRHVPDTAARGATVPLELVWHCERRIGRSYAVFVHLEGPGRFQFDHFPAQGTLLTTSWIPGETIRDGFSVTLPATAPPGLYTAAVGLWDPVRHVRLKSGWFGASAPEAFTIRVTE